MSRLRLVDGAGAFHASFEHQDLWGINARSAFETFEREYPLATSYAERMLLIDRLVHAVHKSGNAAARNLVEGQSARGAGHAGPSGQPPLTRFSVSRNRAETVSCAAVTAL